MEEKKEPISNNGDSKPRFTLTHMRKMTVPQLKIHLESLCLNTVLHECLRFALYPEVAVSNPSQGNNDQNLELQKSGPLLKQIPKGSRPKVAIALTQI